MTLPTASPTPLHIIMESAGGDNGISAGWAALIAAGISGAVAVITTWLNLRHSNKEHRDDITERREERTHSMKTEVAFDVFKLLESYRHLDTKDPIPPELISIEQTDLYAKFSILFPDHLRKELHRLAYAGFELIMAERVTALVEKNSSKDGRVISLEALKKITDSNDRTSKQASAYRQEIDIFLDELRKELGTYQEPLTKKDT